MTQNHHLIDRNGTWYLAWTVGGKRHSVSTRISVGTAEQRTGNIKLARGFRDRFQDHVRRSRLRDPEGLFRELKTILSRLDPPLQEDLRRKWVDELLSAGGRSVPIAAAWDLWERDPQRGSAGAVTRAQYRSEWERFCRWADSAGVPTLQDVDAAAARRYAAALWSAGMSPGTYNAHISFLRSMWSVLDVPCQLRGSNPWTGVGKHVSAPESRREFTQDQLRAICAAAPGNWPAMIAVGLYTALRLGDVACLAWASVDLDNRVLSLIPNKSRRKGSRANVTVPLQSDLSALLRERRELVGGEWVFPEERSSYLADRSTLAKGFGTLLAECGIVTTEAAGEQRRRAVVRYGFHSLRHSFVSLCRRAGVHEQVVMELVGHGSPAMTRLYTHTTPEDRAAAIGSLPRISTVTEPSSASVFFMLQPPHL